MRVRARMTRGRIELPAIHSMFFALLSIDFEVYFLFLKFGGKIIGGLLRKRYTAVNGGLRGKYDCDMRKNERDNTIVILSKGYFY